MSENKTLGRLKEIVIDPKEVPEGACHIRRWGEGKISICKEDGKIKIFEVEKEEE